MAGRPGSHLKKGWLRGHQPHLQIVRRLQLIRQQPVVFGDDLICLFEFGIGLFQSLRTPANSKGQGIDGEAGDSDE